MTPTILRAIRIAAALAVFLLPASSCLGTGLYPLDVQSAFLLPSDSSELRVGFAHTDGRHNLFQQQDVNRRVSEVPSLALRFGLGTRVEGQISYSYLRLQRDGQETVWDSGDTRIAIKAALLADCPGKPATSIIFTSKLPNADDGKDFGTDEADNFIELLASKEISRVTLHLNLGIGILGAPGIEEGQDDLLTYGAGVIIPVGSGVSLLVGASGMDYGQGVNRRGTLQAGLQIPLGKMTWDIGGAVGYVSGSEDWRVTTGLSLPFTTPPLLCPEPGTCSR